MDNLFINKAFPIIRRRPSLGTYFAIHPIASNLIVKSAEFLLGPHLENNLFNLGIYDEARDALKDLGLNIREPINQEEEPGLGVVMSDN